MPGDILVPHVMSTDKGNFTVRNNYLAMIAEIELKTVCPPLGGMESRHLYARTTQLGEITPGKAVTAYLVIKEKDPHSFFGLGQQKVPEPRTQVVSLDDKKLNQEVLSCVPDCGKNCGKSVFPVDQQFTFVAAQKRQIGHIHQGFLGLAQIGAHASALPGHLAQILHSAAHFPVLAGTQQNVSVESAPTEDCV